MAKVRKRGKAYFIDYYDPSGKRVHKSFKLRKDAEVALGQVISNNYNKTEVYNTTLGEVLDRYEEKHKAQSYYQVSKRFYIANFREHFGDDRIANELSYVDVEDYRDHLKTKFT